ncbi:hypothetical protein [Alkalihalobacillus deserti]|nr:hypothetical protein [Alkalihalobacillus deserti]
MSVNSWFFKGMTCSKVFGEHTSLSCRNGEGLLNIRVGFMLS